MDVEKAAPKDGEAQAFDAIVVGAGPAGMYAIHKLRQLGFSVKGIERAGGPGGVWYWNRYPGARCDVESIQYQFGFSDEIQRGWTWTERFPSQPEILAYMEYVTDALELRPHIQFGALVTSAVYDEAAMRWTVRTDQGDVYSAQFCIMATGCLSSAQIPEFPGLGEFKGESYHTGAWPHEPVDLRGKRVGVVGTGSSGVQLIPVVAQDAQALYVFQRTPNFTIPAMNHPLDPAYVEQAKERLLDDRKAALNIGNGTITGAPPKMLSSIADSELTEELEKRWALGNFAMLSFHDLVVDRAANERVSEFIREKIRVAVRDPRVAALLAPDNHPLGTKRPCQDTGYLEAFNRDNVTIVDLRKGPIERITERGIVCQGVEYDLDVIIFATGYDAMTGALARIDIRGKGGLPLVEKWHAGPRTYLGLGSAGFPNLFVLAGPGSPSVLANMIVAAEQHVDWLADCLDYMRRCGFGSIEVQVEAEDAWVDHVNEVAAGTLMVEANSWYMGANIPGKPRIFMPYVGGLNTYRDKCEAVAAAGYEGFSLQRQVETAPA